MEGVGIRRSLIADGCIIGEGTTIENSVIGVRCRIGNRVTIRNSVLMGADFYQGDGKLSAASHPFGVGDDTHIEGAIIDKNCRIGRDVRIANERNLQESPETAECMICDGIVVVPKDAHLPDGWRLGR
jgi:glucose-1-phosphate adenylyltransferase